MGDLKGECMEVFEITVEEIFAQVLEVEAESKEQALSRAREMYQNGNVTLDLCEVEFR